MISKKYKIAWQETWTSFSQMMFILFGLLLLISIGNALMSQDDFSSFFSGNFIIDALAGGVLGSFIGGNPANSYIIGGSLLNEGVAVAAVVAFMITWVTVGFVNIPLESTYFGLKFAILRNFVNFVLAILMGILMGAIIYFIF